MGYVVVAKYNMFTDLFIKKPHVPTIEGGRGCICRPSFIAALLMTGKTRRSIGKLKEAKEERIRRWSGGVGVKSITLRLART